MSTPRVELKVDQRGNHFCHELATKTFSDEDSKMTAGGFAIFGLECSGSYCDNLS